MNTQMKSLQYIPTEYNMYYTINNKVKQIQRSNLMIKLMMTILIIWCIILSVNLYNYANPISEFTDTENQVIMNLEAI